MWGAESLLARKPVKRVDGEPESRAAGKRAEQIEESRKLTAEKVSQVETPVGGAGN